MLLKIALKPYISQLGSFLSYLLLVNRAQENNFREGFIIPDAPRVSSMVRCVFIRSLTCELT